MAKLFKTIVMIAEGKANYENKKPEIERLANERLNVCNGCDLLDIDKEADHAHQKICNKSKGGCGCFLEYKTRVPSENCPKKKWVAKIPK